MQVLLTILVLVGGAGTLAAALFGKLATSGTGRTRALVFAWSGLATWLCIALVGLDRMGAGLLGVLFGLGCVLGLTGLVWMLATLPPRREGAPTAKPWARTAGFVAALVAVDTLTVAGLLQHPAWVRLASVAFSLGATGALVAAYHARRRRGTPPAAA